MRIAGWLTWVPRPASGEFTAANFDPTMTTPATNFRAYTSTLSAAGTNDNASKKVDPQFISNTDLHIAVASPMVDMGVDVGVTDDIDGQLRVAPPDIGADEPSGITPPANDIAARRLLLRRTVPLSRQAQVLVPKPASRMSAPVRRLALGFASRSRAPAEYNYLDNQVIPIINPNQTITVTFAVAPTFTTAGSYSMAALVTTADANVANDQIMGNFTVLTPLAGSYNVPGDFASLTNAGGIFAALNAAGASANITINIAGDLTAETGANALNGLAGGFNVLIRPTGAARTISGSFAGALIRFVGASRVTIDGSLGGPIINRPDASLRSLTIINTSVTTPSVVLFGSVGTTPIINNALRNCVIRNGVNTSSAVVISDSGTLGNPGFFNGIAIQNNSVQKAFIGVYANGEQRPKAGLT